MVCWPFFVKLKASFSIPFCFEVESLLTSTPQDFAKPIAAGVGFPESSKAAANEGPTREIILSA